MVPEDKLGAALRKTAMENKKLIIVIVDSSYVQEINDRYPSLLDLFLEGFWVGQDTRPLLDHMLLVTMDQISYYRCKFRRLNCYRLLTDFEADEKDKFFKFMWKRTEFLLDVLKRGYNFLFSDGDILWLRNPFATLSLYEDGSEDLQISTDWYGGNSLPKDFKINSGFFFVKSNNATIGFFEKWYNMRENSSRIKDQDVLYNLLSKNVHREFGVRLKCLDTSFFSGFCELCKNISTVMTIHANCCPGLSAKLVDLMAILQQWRKYRKMDTWDDRVGLSGWPKHDNCERAWNLSRQIPTSTYGGSKSIRRKLGSVS